MLNISGLDHTDVLRALYDAARPLGLGILHYTPELLSLEEAKTALKEQGSGRFDYFNGRVMKIRIAGNEIDDRLYDRDNGLGAAFVAIQNLRERKLDDPT